MKEILSITLKTRQIQEFRTITIPPLARQTRTITDKTHPF